MRIYLVTVCDGNPSKELFPIVPSAYCTCTCLLLKRTVEQSIAISVPAGIIGFTTG